MQFFVWEQAANLARNWPKPENTALVRASGPSNFQFWTCTLFSLHLCVSSFNHSHMCTHSCTVHNINTFAAHDAQTQQCRLRFHRNQILANEKGCKHFCCCHGNVDSVHMPSIGSEFLTSVCMRVRKTSRGGLANINTSSILWRSQCGAVGGEVMLQQTFGCRGCGRERVRRRRAGLGEVISGFFSITVCSCLGSCCTLDLGDKATRARQRSGSDRKKGLKCHCYF